MATPNMNPTTADKRRAQDMVALEYGGQKGQHQRNLDAIQMLLNRDVNAQQGYAREADSRLEQVYGQLQGQLQGNKQDIQGQYQQGASNVNDAYDQARQFLARSNQQNTGQVQSSAEKLGLANSGVGDSEAGQLNDQMQLLQAHNESARARELSYQGNLGANYGASATQAISDAARQGAFQRSGLQRDVQGSIADLQGTAGLQRYDILSQLSDLAQQEGIAERVLTQEMTEGRLDRERQSELDALAELIQRGTLDIQRGQLGIQRSQLGLDEQQLGWNREQQLWERNITMQQLEMEKQRLQQTIAEANDPTAKAYAELQLQKLQADIDAVLAQTNAPASVGDYSGVSGARQYADDMGHPTNYVSSVQRILDSPELAGARDNRGMFSQYLGQNFENESQAHLIPIYLDLYDILMGNF